MRVAVLGGGVVGLAVAWRLARSRHTVDLFDDAPGTGASHAAAGMLSPAGEAWFGEDALTRLGAVSRALWPQFAASLSEAAGHDVWLRTDGSLLVAADGADADDLDRLHRILESHDLEARRLTRRETRSLEPGLATSIRGGLHVPHDLSVHNRRVIDALVRACSRLGVRLHAERADVLTDDDGAHGVRGRESRRDTGAEAVVVAAGAALGDVTGLPENLRTAVRPVKGQILRLSSSGDLVRRTVRARVRGETVYAVPRRDGEVVVGATSEEKGDDTVTADGLYEVLRRGIAVLPGLRECTVKEALARTRPGTADNGPLVGPTTAPNLYVAGGHYRGGVLLAPVTAEAVTAMVDGRPPPQEVEPFSPARVGGGRA